MSNKKNQKEKLSGPWKEIQGAIWLIGLAILFLNDWFWPGILILIGISGIFEAVVRLVINPSATPELASAPGGTGENKLNIETTSPKSSLKLPDRCPYCGAPVSSESVTWSQDYQYASCPYCKTNLKAS